MTMHELLMLIMAGAAGLVLGVIFFGGLWWTVRKAVFSSRPALWFMGSLLLRTSLVLTGFYVVGGNQWQRLLVCLIGFIFARVFVVRFTRLFGEHSNSHAHGARHAT